MSANFAQAHETNIQIIQAKAKELGWFDSDDSIQSGKWNAVIDILDAENPLWRGYPVDYRGCTKKAKKTVKNSEDKYVLTAEIKQQFEPVSTSDLNLFLSNIRVEIKNNKARYAITKHNNVVAYAVPVEVANSLPLKKTEDIRMTAFYSDRKLVFERLKFNTVDCFFVFNYGVPAIAVLHPKFGANLMNATQNHAQARS